MNCDELLAALNEYVDGSLDPSICEEYRSHLEGCNPCQIVIDNLRQTISLYRAGEPYELPAQLHTQLHGLLRTRWKAKFPSAVV